MDGRDVQKSATKDEIVDTSEPGKAVESFKLSNYVEAAHGSDVRCVEVGRSESESYLVYTGGRDKLAKRWSIDKKSLEVTSQAIVDQAAGYVNAIVLMGGDARQILAIGLATGTVDLYDTAGHEKIFSLSDHSSNVCHLAYYGSVNWLVSCSWDQSICVYDVSGDCGRPRLLKQLRDHDICVWCTAFSAECDLLLSGSANGKIGVWRRSLDTNSVRFDRFLSDFHSECVRCVCVIGGQNTRLAASASNDTTIAVFGLDSFELKHRLLGHENFIFDLISVHDGHKNLLISGSEDNTVRIWDSNNWSIEQIVHLPTTTCWALAYVDGTVFAACSDGNLWIISRRNPEMKELNHKLAAFTIPPPESSLIVSNGTPTTRGRFIGDYMYGSNGDSIIVKHAWTGELWRSSGHCKREVESEELLVHVNHENSENQMQLRFKRNEDPDVVADRFMAENGIDPAFKSQIVDFIKAQTPTKPTTTTTTTDSIPSQMYVGFESLSVDAVLDRLRLHSQQLSSQNCIDSETLRAIESNVRSLSSNNWDPSISNSLLQLVMEICEQWPKKYIFPLLDLIRWMLVNTDSPSQYEQTLEYVSFLIRDGECVSISLNCVVFLRIIANLFLSQQGNQVFVKQSEEILALIMTVFMAHSSDQKVVKAFASVFHNYGLFHYKTGNGGQVFKSFIEAFPLQVVIDWHAESVDLCMKGYANAILAPVGSLLLDSKPLLGLVQSVLNKNDWTQVKHEDSRCVENVRNTCNAIKQKLA